MDDERIIALAQHLNIEIHLIENNAEEINESRYGDNCYEYDGCEYRILTDSEADIAERESVESVIEDCYLTEFTRDNKNHPALKYINMEEWIDDWCDNRGENLSGYDGIENEE